MARPMDHKIVKLFDVLTMLNYELMNKYNSWRVMVNGLKRLVDLVHIGTIYSNSSTIKRKPLKERMVLMLGSHYQRA